MPGLIAALPAPGSTPADRIISFHVGQMLLVALVRLLACSVVGVVVVALRLLLAGGPKGADRVHASLQRAGRLSGLFTSGLLRRAELMRVRGRWSRGSAASPGDDGRSLSL